jgi:hypothetical protein
MEVGLFLRDTLQSDLANSQLTSHASLLCRSAVCGPCVAALLAKRSAAVVTYAIAAVTAFQ